MRQTYDVMVLGGGIVGAATAYSLAKRGQAVLLIDQFEPGHNRGSSHGDGRVLRFNYSDAIYVQMAKLAYPAWEALSERVGQTLLQKTGLLEYGPADCVPIAESEANLQKNDLPYDCLTAAESNQRFPHFHFQAGTSILYQPDGAVAFATKAVKALWALSKELGATTISGVQIRNIDLSHGEVTLQAADGMSWRGKKALITAGAWAAQMLEEVRLRIPLEVTQELLAYFAPKDELDHRVGKMPVMVDYHDTETPFYCLPQTEIAGVKVGWHRSGDVINPHDERWESQTLLSGMATWIERLFPHLNPQAIELSTCLYTSTPDHHFVLDKHPQTSNIIIGAGFSGHGFKFGPLLGDILAALAMGHESPISLDTFRLKRFENPNQLQKRRGA